VKPGNLRMTINVPDLWIVLIAPQSQRRDVCRAAQRRRCLVVVGVKNFHL
jgi:hypothetical protein